MGTVLARVCIVWFASIPAGEDNTKASRFKNPLPLRFTISDAKPELQTSKVLKKVVFLEVAYDGAVLLCIVDLNEDRWEELLFFTEFLCHSLGQSGRVEPRKGRGVGRTNTIFCEC